MDEYKLITNQYIIYHNIKIPSKLSDYDYDPCNPHRRFITTYLHNLEFRDSITESPLVSLNFSSETCATLITSLYSMIIGNGIIEKSKSINTDIVYDKNRKIVITIKDIYIDGTYTKPANVVIAKINNNIKINILYKGDKTCISLHPNDVPRLIDLLEIEELVDMYVVNSSDREVYFK